MSLNKQEAINIPSVRDYTAREALLRVRELSIAIRIGQKEFFAVEDISFNLQAGEALGIVGESGSGKSLTARALMGLQPSNIRIASGEIFFDGKDVLKLPARRVRKMCGSEMAMIFQEPKRALDPIMRIGAQISEAVKAHQTVTGREARSRSVELLERVRIPAAASRLGDYPHQLSGGMQQRVMIAIALASRPRLLIADEPTTALDVTTQANILDLLEELRQDLDMAIILITHDLGVAARYSDRVAVMYAGRIVEAAATRELFAYQRMPYTRGLFNSIIDLEGVPHKPLPAIGGQPPSLTNMPSGCRFNPRCPRSSEQCVAHAPKLTSDWAGHFYACWHPLYE